MAFPARIAIAVLLLAMPAAAQESLPTQNVPPDNASTNDTASTSANALPNSDVLPTSNALPSSSLLPDKPAPRGNFLTRPFYDKKVRLLAELNAGAAVMDDVASRMVIESGGYERNPLMRPFVHNSGTLAVESITEVWLMAYLGDRMKHSSHPLLRMTWWLPQTLNISGKVSGGIYNSVLLTR
jgi:hypothetical protein